MSNKVVKYSENAKIYFYDRVYVPITNTAVVYSNKSIDFI